MVLSMISSYQAVLTEQTAVQSQVLISVSYTSITKSLDTTTVMYVLGYWNEFRIKSEMLHGGDCSKDSERAETGKPIIHKHSRGPTLLYSMLLPGTSK